MTTDERKPGRWQRPFIGPFNMLQTLAVLAAVYGGWRLWQRSRRSPTPP